jgi:GNAT superfamily N-acetyltransferase
MSGQRTLSLEMREFEPTDYPRLLEIYNANYPDYARSVEEWRTRDESVDRSKYYLQRYTFLENKATVGFGDLSHVTDMFHPQKFWINIFVDPPSQGRGIGSSMYERLSGELRKLKAVAAWAGSKEDLPRLTEFYQRRGFAEKLKVWESRLNIRTMDLARFREYPEKALRQGITFTTLATERDKGPDSLRKLHELVQLISADMPSPAPFTPISYEQWEAFELRNPSLLPEGYMIAKDGSKYVGLSTVWRIDQEPTGLVQGNTGVRREYRGRGIAVALKLKVIDFARRNGYEKMKTWNASNNAPMLAVNTKLGFKREVGWITLEKELTPT